MTSPYAVQNAYTQGAAAVYASLGLTKAAAISLDQVKRVLTRPFRFGAPPSGPADTIPKAIWQSVAPSLDMARHIAIGSPIDEWKRFQQLRQERGSVGAYGKLLKDYMWAPSHPNESGWVKWPTRLMQGAGLLATAHEGYRALTGPADQRVGDLAAFGTSLLAGPVTGTLGMFGGPVAHNTLTNAARQLGHRFDTPTDRPLEMPARRDPQGHYGRAVRSLNTLQDVPRPEPG